MIYYFGGLIIVLKVHSARKSFDHKDQLQSWLIHFFDIRTHQNTILQKINVKI